MARDKVMELSGGIEKDTIMMGKGEGGLLGIVKHHSENTTKKGNYYRT